MKNEKMKSCFIALDEYSNNFERIVKNMAHDHYRYFYFMSASQIDKKFIDSIKNKKGNLKGVKIFFIYPANVIVWQNKMFDFSLPICAKNESELLSITVRSVNSIIFNGNPYIIEKCKKIYPNAEYINLENYDYA